MDLKAHVPRDILDLIPEFLRNRRADLELMQAALAKRNFEALQYIGQQMYAVGEPYGFGQITAYGQKLREASAIRDIAQIDKLIDTYRTYLSQVGVVPVAAPASPSPRPATSAHVDLARVAEVDEPEEAQANGHMHSGVAAMEPVTDRPPNTTSRLIAIAIFLTGAAHEVQAKMQCSESDFRDYCAGAKEPTMAQFDRLVTLMVREQQKLIAKNRARLRS